MIGAVATNAHCYRWVPPLITAGSGRITLLYGERPLERLSFGDDRLRYRFPGSSFPRIKKVAKANIESLNIECYASHLSVVL